MLASPPTLMASVPFTPAAVISTSPAPAEPASVAVISAPATDTPSSASRTTSPSFAVTLVAPVPSSRLTLSAAYTLTDFPASTTAPFHAVKDETLAAGAPTRTSPAVAFTVDSLITTLPSTAGVVVSSEAAITTSSAAVTVALLVPLAIVTSPLVAVIETFAAAAGGVAAGLTFA